MQKYFSKKIYDSRIAYLCENIIIMTIEEAVDLVRFIVNDKMPGKEMQVEELNDILKVVDYDLYQEFHGQPNSPKGFETEELYTNALRGFKTLATISLTSGTGTLPADYFHWGKCSYGATNIPIELVTTKEAEQRKFNAINVPNSRYPILELFPNEFRVTPTSITSVDLVYLRRPIPAVYAVALTNGVQQYYSAGSTQIDWPAEVHTSYIRHILKYLSLSINDQGIVNYVEQKQQQVT